MKDQYVGSLHPLEPETDGYPLRLLSISMLPYSNDE